MPPTSYLLPFYFTPTYLLLTSYFIHTSLLLHTHLPPTSHLLPSYLPLTYLLLTSYLPPTSYLLLSHFTPTSLPPHTYFPPPLLFFYFIQVLFLCHPLSCQTIFGSGRSSSLTIIFQYVSSKFFVLIETLDIIYLKTIERVFKEYIQ